MTCPAIARLELAVEAVVLMRSDLVAVAAVHWLEEVEPVVAAVDTSFWFAFRADTGRGKSGKSCENCFYVGRKETHFDSLDLNDSFLVCSFCS